MHDLSFAADRKLSARLFTPQTSLLIRFVLMLAVCAVFLGFAAAPRRAFQLWSFVVPFALLWLSQAERRSGTASLLRGVAFVSFLLSVLDGGIRGFIREVYAADPMSGFVLESVANTNPSESLEFLGTILPDVLLWCAYGFGTLAIVGALMFARLPRSHGGYTRKWIALPVVALLAILTIVSWSLRPWRNQLPPVYWTNWAGRVASMQEKWANLEVQWQKEAELAAASFISADDAPKTFVLVIGESTARDHWSLYGYSRKTTPKLEARAESDDRFITVRDVWSVDGSTVAAFNSMFLVPKTDPNASRENLFALFRQAGWKITWISNQEDLAIRNQYAHWADEQIFLNRVGGRSSVSLDERVLKPLEKALADNAPRHLIVVHLIGAHPHYSLRYPADWESDWPDDAVDEKLKSLDRSPWVIKAIDTYDTAMRYQDQVIAQTLDLAEAAARSEKPVIWSYISDHGQELGEAENRTGHSQTTPDGYRVPFVVWSSDGRFKKPIEAKPFRADLLDTWMLSAAGIERKDEMPKEDIASQQYDFDAPKLPMRDPELEAYREN